MSERESLVDLARTCRALTHIYGGTYWRHYKGQAYKITGFGIDEETNDIEVRYSPVIIQDSPRGPAIKKCRETDDLEFHRTRDKFFSFLDEGETTQRFTRVEVLILIGLDE